MWWCRVRVSLTVTVWPVQRQPQPQPLPDQNEDKYFFQKNVLIKCCGGVGSVFIAIHLTYYLSFNMRHQVGWLHWLSSSGWQYWDKPQVETIRLILWKVLLTTAGYFLVLRWDNKWEQPVEPAVWHHPSLLWPGLVILPFLLSVSKILPTPLPPSPAWFLILWRSESWNVKYFLSNCRVEKRPLYWHFQPLRGRAWVATDQF